MQSRTNRGRACLREYLCISRLLSLIVYSPHVAGLAALIMGQEGKISPIALKQKLVASSALGVVSGIPFGTTNTLGNNGATPV